MNRKQIKKSQPITESSVRETKIYTVLSQLSVYDINRLKKFVASPYFNRNEDLSKLLDSLDQDLRRKDGTYFGREIIWTELYGQQSFNDLKFRKLCSDLLRLTEEFLAQEIFSQNSLQQADNLLLAVYNRKIEALYNGVLTNAARLSKQYYFRPASYYFYEYAFEWSYYNLSGLELKRTEQANLERIAQNLDIFYLAEKLRCFCIMTDRQKVAAHGYKMPFINEIISYVEANNLVDVVPINLYYQIHLTQSEPDNLAHFERLKILIEQYIDRLPQAEAFEILDSALNYCVRKINRGEGNFLREYNDLSLMGIRKEILLVNGILSPWTFRNIVVIGLRLRDFKWVHNFIDNYKELIDDQYRDNAVSFNLANLYFYEKKYADVMGLLQMIEYDDPSYNRNSKTILIATYYELKEVELLSSLLASFELYLRRNKDMPEDRKTPYYNLIKFMRALVKIGDRSAISLSKLRQKVDGTESVVNKDWLLEKIDELLGNEKNQSLK